MNNKMHMHNFLTALLLFASMYLHAINNTVVATITTGVTPDSIAITPDNRTAYVANNNNYGIDNQDSVTVLNLTNNTVVTTIHDESFDEPFRIAINPDGTKAYVTNSNSTTISIIDTKTNKVTGIIDGFDGPSGMVISPSGRRAYVNNYGAGDRSGLARSVRFVSLVSNTIIGEEIIVDQAPAALAMSPDGQYVYVISYVDGNPGTGTMSIIRTSDNTVIDVIPGFSGPFSIALTPNGKYAYITNFGSNNFTPIGTTVTVVNAREHTIVATIDLGIQPSGVAITPDGHFAYVTNYNTLYANSTNFTGLTAGQGTVNIINVKKKKLIPPTIAVGQSPNSIAIAPDGKHAYVTNFTSNVVTVIKIKD